MDIKKPGWMNDEQGYITEETAAELDRLGIPVPSWVTIRPAVDVPKDTIYIVMRYIEGDELIQPTNMLDKCSMCSHAVQMSVNGPRHLKMVCGPCAQELAEAGGVN